MKCIQINGTVEQEPIEGIRIIAKRLKDLILYSQGHRAYNFNNDALKEPIDKFRQFIKELTESEKTEYSDKEYIEMLRTIFNFSTTIDGSMPKDKGECSEGYDERMKETLAAMKTELETDNIEFEPGDPMDLFEWENDDYLQAMSTMVAQLMDSLNIKSSPKTTQSPQYGFKIIEKIFYRMKEIIKQNPGIDNSRFEKLIQQRLNICYEGEKETNEDALIDNYEKISSSLLLLYNMLETIEVKEEKTLHDKKILRSLLDRINKVCAKYTQGEGTRTPIR